MEGAVLALVDISEHKRAESSLRANETRLQTFIAQSCAAVCELSLDGRIKYVNDRFCEMLDYTREELLEKRLRDITHREDLPRISVQFDANVAGGADFESQMRFMRGDGTPVWTNTGVSGIRNAEGRLQSLVVNSFDISERKRLEAELSRTDAQLARDLGAINRLHAVGTLYAGESSVPAVLDEIVAAAMFIGEADMGALQLVDADGQLKVATQHGFGQPRIDFWNCAGPGEGACRL